MKLILSGLFISAIALALPVEDVDSRYNELIQTVEFIEDLYNSLPDPRRHYMNSSTIIRLSYHLKRNFEEIREQVLEEMCGGESKCYGSQAYRKGVIKVCLHTDDYVSHQVELYENLIKCSESFLSDHINKSESTNDKMEELRYSKMKLINEYNDVKNRHELDMVLDYHEQIIRKEGKAVLSSIESLKNLYADVESSMKSCSQAGYPKINKKLYSYASVQQCMRDFLSSEPERDDPPEEPHKVSNESSKEESQENQHPTEEISNAADSSQDDYSED